MAGLSRGTSWRGRPRFLRRGDANAFPLEELLAESCYNRFAAIVECRVQPTHRGVAQPGRAPGSGPGGRRFKSSLPDQHFFRPSISDTYSPEPSRHFELLLERLDSCRIADNPGVFASRPSGLRRLRPRG